MVFPFAIWAQIAERTVIGCAGGFISATGITVSSTIGETFVATSSTPNLIISQGFQQSMIYGVGIEENSMGFSVKAYPNPTSGAITLDFTVQQALQVYVDMFDIQGRMVMPSKQLNLHGNMTDILNLEGFASGNYFIRISNPDGKLNERIQIQKAY